MPLCIVLQWYFSRRFHCFVSICHCDFGTLVHHIWWPFLVFWITLFSSSGRGEYVMKCSLSSISYGCCVSSFTDTLKWKLLKNPVILVSSFPLWLSLIYGSITPLLFLSHTFAQPSVHNASYFVSFVLYIPVRSTEVHPFVIWPISFGLGPSSYILCVWLFSMYLIF